MSWNVALTLPSISSIVAIVLPVVFVICVISKDSIASFTALGVAANTSLVLSIALDNKVTPYTAVVAIFGVTEVEVFPAILILKVGLLSLVPETASCHVIAGENNA